MPPDEAHGSNRPAPPREKSRARRTHLHRAAHQAMVISSRLGRRLQFQLAQLEAADAGNAVMLEGESKPRIGTGETGSAGLPTRDWLWMYRQHGEIVVRLLTEERLRAQMPRAGTGGESEEDDRKALAEVAELLDKETLQVELARRNSVAKDGNG